MVFLLCILFLLSPSLSAAPQANAIISARYTHVVIHETNYYIHGPQQAMPPQGKLRPGTKVIIIQDMGSYARVKSENGIEAVVSAESLRKIK